MPSTPLSAKDVAALDQPGMHRVDRGLYLQIKDNGARSWLLRYQLNGRPRQMGLGPLRLVPLSDARNRAIRHQKQILDGTDPIDARQADAKRQSGSGIPTFAKCAEGYIAAHKAGWRNEKHAEQWERTLVTFANPTMGKLAVNAVTVDHVVEVLKPIWSTKSETAGRLRGRIERVLDWARARGFREGDNPARWKGALSHLLPPLSKVQKIEHHPALPYADVPAMLREIQGRDGNSSAALQFVILTAARSGEVRGATWEEFDLAKKLWVVPADRMKGAREHRVPLSPEAIAILEKQPQSGPFVFPGAREGKPLSDMSLIEVVRKLRGSGITVHGFRSSFRDWAAEKTTCSREVVEAALAHVVGDKTEAAYFRSDLLDQRRELMVAWAAFLTSVADT